MKGCETIAEYAIKRWMQDNRFVMNEFSIVMNGDEADIFDKTGDSMRVFYNKKANKVVIIE